MFNWFPRRRSRRLKNESAGSILWRPSVSQEVDADLTFHLDMLVREYQESGMDRETAKARARARRATRIDPSSALRAE